MFNNFVDNDKKFYNTRFFIWLFTRSYNFVLGPSNSVRVLRSVEKLWDMLILEFLFSSDKKEFNIDNVQCAYFNWRSGQFQDLLFFSDRAGLHFLAFGKNIRNIFVGFYPLALMHIQVAPSLRYGHRVLRLCVRFEF
jgi:hypothetical protein